MAVESHLILQEILLRPGGEWTPPTNHWVVARIAEGVGYWMHGGNAREFKVGDGLVVSKNFQFTLRASQLEPLQVEFFLVQPELLTGAINFPCLLRTPLPRLFPFLPANLWD